MHIRGKQHGIELCPAGARRIGAMLVVGFAVVFVLWGAPVVFARSPSLTNLEASSAETPIGFRRVFVPANLPSAWPVESDRYLPIDKAELQRLLVARQQANLGPPRVEQIQLTARIEGGQLIGHGTMRMAAANQQPSFLPWPNNVMQINNAHWQPPLAGEALLGVWLPDPLDRASGAGDFGLVARTGDLTFNFAIAPQPTGPQQKFRIPLPQAMDRRLILELPASLQPLAPNALVERLSERSEHNPLLHRWLVRPLAGQVLQCEIAAPQSPAAPAKPLFSLAEETDVFLAVGGAEVRTAWRLRPRASLSATPAAPAELFVDLPDDLSILRVLVNGAPVEWQVERPAAEQPVLRIGLSGEAAIRPAPSEQAQDDAEQPDDDPFLEPTQQGTTQRRDALFSRNNELKVVVEAWSTAQLSQQFSKPWQLPTLTMQNVLWREGAAQVRVASELQLVDVPQSSGAIFTMHRDSAEAVTPATALPEYKFLFLRPGPQIQLNLQPTSQRLEVELDQHCELSDAQARSVVTLKVSSRSPRGPRMLAAEMAPEWEVESVESKSTGVIEDWLVDRTSANQASPRQPAQLMLQLGSSTEPAEQIIEITCRRVFPGLSSPLRSLVPFRLVDVDQMTNRLWLTTVEPYSLLLSDVDRQPTPQWLLLGDRSPRRSELNLDLASSRGGELFASSNVFLTRRAVEYDANIQIYATITEQGVLYQAEVEIDSPATLGRPFTCYFNRPLPGQPTWYDPESLTPLDARRLGGDSQAEQLDTNRGQSQREQWSVRPGASEGTTVRLAVKSLVPWADATRIPLIALPGAKQQTGLIRLRDADLSRMAIRHARMAAQPSHDADAVVYEYDPRRVLELRQQPWLSLQLEPDAKSVNLPARLVEIETVWSPNSAATHEAVYQFDPSAKQWSFRLPPNAELLGVTDPAGRLVAATRAQDDARGMAAPYRVALSGEAASTLRIAYRQPQSPGEQSPGELTIAPARLAGEALATNWRWTLKLPAQWSVAGRPAADRDWRRRLFGPLSQAAGDRPFNPLRGEDWRGLAQSLGAPRRAIAAQLHDPSSQGADERPSPATLAGWHLHQWAGSESPLAAVRVYERTRWRFAALALQFLVMALVVCWVVPRPSLFFATLLTTLLLALVAPASLSPFASALWFGAVTAWPVCWLLHIVAQPRGVDQRASSRHSVASGSLSASGMLTPVLLALLLGAASLAQPAPGGITLAEAAEAPTPPATGTTQDASEPDATQDETVIELEKILVPIDDQNQPVGDKSYLRESFLRSLLAADRRRQVPGPSAVVVQRIAYQAELLSATPGETAQAGRWVLTMHLETAHRGAVVHLPLRRADAEWAATVSIDGVPATLSWNARGASFVAPEPGPCIATIAFAPRATTTLDAQTGKPVVKVQFVAPTMAGAELLVTYPESITGVRMPKAHELPVDRPQRYRALLGAGSLVELVWNGPRVSSGAVAPEAAGGATAAGGPHAPAADQPPVELLQWIHISEEQVVADVRLMAAVPDVAARIAPVELAIPVGWESVEQPDAKRISVAWETRPAADVEPAEEQQASPRLVSKVVQLRQRRGSSLGIVRVPSIMASRSEVRRRLVAVSVEGPLVRTRATSESGSAEPASLAPREFLAKWATDAESTLSPPAAIAQLLDNASWSFGIAPAQESFALTSQRLNLVAGAQRIECRLVVDGMRGRSPLMVIETPADFQVERITVQAGDERRTPRWAQPSPNRLVVFAPLLASRSLQLQVHGSVATPAQSASVPCLRLVGSRNGFVETTIARTDEVVVEVEDAQFTLRELLRSIPTKFGPAALLGTADPSSAGWHVATVRLDPENPPALEVTQNPRKVRIAAGTAYWREAGVTYAHWTADLQVEQGLVGSLLLASPAEQLDQVQLIAPLGAKLVAESQPAQGLGSAWRLLLAEPLQAGESMRVEIRIRASSDVGGVLATPLLVAPSASSVEQRIGIPRLADAPSSSVRWSVFGLRSVNNTNTPRHTAALLPADRPWRLFMAEAPGTGSRDDSQADQTTAGSVFWTAASTQEGLLSIPLAEFAFLPLPPDNSEQARLLSARYLIQPRGAERCRLKLAEGQMLRRVIINGQKALCQPATREESRDSSYRDWDIELRSAQLPQTMEVLIVSTPQLPQAVAPTISTGRQGDILPQQVLWLVKASPGQQVNAPPDARQLAAERVELIRLDALVSAAAKIESPHPVWSANWRGEVAKAVSRLCAAADLPIPIAGEDLPADFDLAAEDASPLPDSPTSDSPTSDAPLAGNLATASEQRDTLIVAIRRAQQWLRDFEGPGSDDAEADDTWPTDTAPTDTAPTDTAPTDTAPTDTAPTDTAPNDVGTIITNTPPTGQARTTASYRPNSSTHFSASDEGGEIQSLTFWVDAPTRLTPPSVAAAAAGDLQGRFVAALVVVALLIAVQHQWRPKWRQLPLGQTAREYRHALGAVGGVAWWLLLEPSSLGLVILAASVAGQLRLFWLRGPLPETY